MMFETIKVYGRGTKVIDTFTPRHLDAEWADLLDYIQQMEPGQQVSITVSRLGD